VIVVIAPDSELKLLSVSTPARGHHLMMRVREWTSDWEYLMNLAGISICC